MIASRVVDVCRLPIPQEHLTAQGIAVWNESKHVTDNSQNAAQNTTVINSNVILGKKGKMPQ